VALVVAGVTVLPLAAARVSNTAVASLPLHDAPAIANHADSQSTPPALTSSLRTHCLDCHDGARGKGGFDLNTVLDGAQPSALRAVRARLARQDMPPIEETERPSAAEYAAMIGAIDAAVPPARREVPLVRRLNRWQVANSIRDTIGCLGAEASTAGVTVSTKADQRTAPKAAARSVMKCVVLGYCL
jgi:mono/diheme cytochrome c family protein